MKQIANEELQELANYLNVKMYEPFRISHCNDDYVYKIANKGILIHYRNKYSNSPMWAYKNEDFDYIKEHKDHIIAKGQIAVVSYGKMQKRLKGEEKQNIMTDFTDDEIKMLLAIVKACKISNITNSNKYKVIKEKLNGIMEKNKNE